MSSENLMLRIGVDIKQRLKIHAICNGKSASAVASQAIQEFLDRAESETVPAVESPKPKRRGKRVAA